MCVPRERVCVRARPFTHPVVSQEFEAAAAAAAAGGGGIGLCPDFTLPVDLYPPPSTPHPLPILGHEW